MKLFGINILGTFQQPQIADQPKDILDLLKELHSGYFFNPNKALVAKLKEVKPAELKQVLNQFFAAMVKEDRITDPALFLDRLTTLIPLEQLQEAVDIRDALKEATAMFEEAKFYLQTTNETTSPSIQALLSSTLEGIISVIDIIVLAFGIGEFFKTADSDIQADFKSQKIMMLLSLFSMITTMLLPILGVETGALIIGGILLAIAALSAIWPFIKPITTHLPANAENWTRQVRNGNFVAHGRKESLDEIANIIKMKRHAILVGPSRVGKSLTAKAFAQAVERGDYPELKGKVVFRINTSDLLEQKASFLGGGNDILNKISAAMGRHRDDLILVFDEIHMACKNNEKLADTMKTFLDEHGDFPHVIGITTEDEYNEHVRDNNAFSLRFDRVDIINTSEDETIRILGDTLLRSPSHPLIKADALDYIYAKSSEILTAPQPSASLKLLKRCINRTEKTQKSPTEQKIIEISNRILSLHSQAAASRGRKKEGKGEIARLEEELKKLQVTLSKEKLELDKLYKSKDLLDQVTKGTYSTILKISAVAEKTLSSKTEKQLKLFLLLHEFLSRTLESHVETTANDLEVHAFIDNELIEEVASA